MAIVLIRLDLRPCGDPRQRSCGTFAYESDTKILDNDGHRAGVMKYKWKAYSNSISANVGSETMGLKTL
jgi:hypothetical protein